MIKHAQLVTPDLDKSSEIFNSQSKFIILPESDELPSLKKRGNLTLEYFH